MEPEFNRADDCNLLLVVDKGVGEEEFVAWFEIANNQNGLACNDSNLCQMMGLVVESGSLSALSTPDRERKMIDLMKFTKKGPEVNNKEGVVCLTHGSNQ